MAETIDTKLVNFFNSYLFRNVWNEPSKEYRRNVRPELISKKVANTVLKLDIKRYNLPTADKYHVYYIPESAMSGLTLRDYPDWITAKAFLDLTEVEIRFHNNAGVMLPRDMVYITNHPEKAGMLVAVKRSLSRKIHGDAVDYDDFFVAFYYDSDMTGDIIIRNYVLDGDIDINSVYLDTLGASVVYVNGIATIVSSVDDINVEDAIVEVVHDHNVIAEFELDLTDTNQQRNFISSVSLDARTIVHIPKAMNPSNKVISHHTCDVWIYPANGVAAHRNGRLLHRAIEEYSFSQVTHNDFSIPSLVISSYSDVLNTDEFKLVIKIRNHSKNNTLVTDKNFIGLLYSHDDQTILDFLEGDGPAAFDFWKARTLEASEYVKMISDVPNFTNVSNLPKYIGALGYHNSIALISERVKTVVLDTYNGNVSHRFIVPIPIVFESVRIHPSVFVNGIKLNNNLIVVNRVQSGSVVIDVDESVVLNEADIVKVELFEDIPINIKEVRPTSTYTHIDVVNDNFVMYEIVDDVGGDPAQGIEETFNLVYKRINVIDVGAYVDSVGGRYIAFNPSAYGRRFIIAESVGFKYRTYNIDSMLENNDPLAFTLSTNVSSIDFEPPLVWQNHTAKASATGEIYDPEDLDAEIQYPAWHLMDGDETWAVDKRWVTDLRFGGNSAYFDLAAPYRNTYYLIGYRVGSMPNKNDALRASQLPVNWQIFVDGNLVDSVNKEWWYLNPEVVHTHILNVPVLVDTRIEFKISGIQTDGVFQIQTDLFEPIFSDAIDNINIPELGDVTCIPYLNGKELVKNIDYHLADIQNPLVEDTHLAGRQLVVNNAAYLQDENNVLEILICHNGVNGELGGFIDRPYLGTVNANPRWFNELSMVAVNGLVTKNISTLFGTVQIPCPDVINEDLKAYFPINDDILSTVNSSTYVMTLNGSAALQTDTEYDSKIGINIPSGSSAVIQLPVALPADYTFAATLRAKTSLVPVVGKAFTVGLPTTGFEVIRDDQLWKLSINNGATTWIIDDVTEEPVNIAVVVSDNTAFSVYVNGTLKLVGTFASTRVASTITLDSTGLPGAYVYDVMFFHRVLDNTEIVQVAAISEDVQFRLGAPYGTRTYVPPKSEYFVDRYYPYPDDEVLDQLTEYFRGTVNSEPVVMIPYSHRVVSIRIHVILRDMLNGSLVVPYEPLLLITIT
jgi:hypothetical protein